MATRYLEGARATLQQQADSLWSLYLAEQRAARGLRPTDSLDTEITYGRNGERTQRVMPMTDAPTTAYASVVSESATVACLEIDDWSQSQQGRGGVDVRGSKQFEELTQSLRDLLRPTLRENTAVAGTLAGSNPRGGSPR